MRDRIWHEMVEAKLRGYYAKLFLCEQRKVNKWFNAFILIFSASGVLGWSFWKDFPVLTSVVVSGMSLLKIIGTEFLPNEKVFEKADKVIDFYFDYYNQLEDLWYDHYNDIVEEGETKERFYRIVNTEKSINQMVNEIIRRQDLKILSKAELECTSYFDRVFKL